MYLCVSETVIQIFLKRKLFEKKHEIGSKKDYNNYVSTIYFKNDVIHYISKEWADVSN